LANVTDWPFILTGYWNTKFSVLWCSFYSEFLVWF
jgi:hypothetical protein